MADVEWDDPDFLAALDEAECNTQEGVVNTNIINMRPVTINNNYVAYNSGPTNSQTYAVNPSPTGHSTLKRPHPDAEAADDEPPPLDCPCGAGACLVLKSKTAANPGALCRPRP